MYSINILEVSIIFSFGHQPPQNIISSPIIYRIVGRYIGMEVQEWYPSTAKLTRFVAEKISEDSQKCQIAKQLPSCQKVAKLPGNC